MVCYYPNRTLSCRYTQLLSVIEVSQARCAKSTGNNCQCPAGHCLVTVDQGNASTTSRMQAEGLHLAANGRKMQTPAGALGLRSEPGAAQPV
jgi:hypothetical protein